MHVCLGQAANPPDNPPEASSAPVAQASTPVAEVREVKTEPVSASNSAQGTPVTQSFLLRANRLSRGLNNINASMGN